MIIDYNCTFKHYSEIQKKAMEDGFVTWDYQCPKCLAQKQLHYHSSYDRNVLILEEDGLQLCAVQIIRLVCESCGCTHAILFAEAIPFWQMTVQAVFFLLSMLIVDNQAFQPVKASRATEVSYQLLGRYLIILQGHYDQLVLLLRSMALWQETKNPTLQDVVIIARSGAPPFPQKEFFTQNQSPLFLHRRSTVSYPLRIGGS